jgi:hypothetical protein
VEEVENIIYHGAHATLARIHLDGQPDQAALARIRDGNPDIISAELSAIDGRGPRNGNDQPVGEPTRKKPRQQLAADERSIS